MPGGLSKSGQLKLLLGLWDAIKYLSFVSKPFAVFLSKDWDRDIEALQHYARERRGLLQTKQEEQMTTLDSDFIAFGPDAPTALNTFFTKNGGTPSFVLGVGGFGSTAGAYGETEPVSPPNVVAGVYGAGNLQRASSAFRAKMSVSTVRRSSGSACKAQHSEVPVPRAGRSSGSAC